MVERIVTTAKWTCRFSSIEKKNNQKNKVTGYIPDTLAKVVHGLVAEWKFHQMKAKNDVKHEGTRVLLSRIESSCIYLLKGQRLIKVVYERNLNNVKKYVRNLNMWERFDVLKNTSIHFTSVNVTLINMTFSWLSISAGGLLHGW